MNTFTLYDEFITLGKLLKEAAIIETGGAAKQFLATHDVQYNGDYENRRGKKLYDGDVLTFPDLNLEINIVAASPDDIAAKQAEEAEAERVKAIVKKMNAENKQNKQRQKAAAQSQDQYFKRRNGKPKFPGTK